MADIEILKAKVAQGDTLAVEYTAAENATARNRVRSVEVNKTKEDLTKELATVTIAKVKMKPKPNFRSNSNPILNYS